MNRGYDQMNFRLVAQRKARPGSWRRLEQGDKSPHGPLVRPVAGNLQTKSDHNQTNYCLVSCRKSRAKGLETTGNLLMM